LQQKKEGSRLKKAMATLLSSLSLLRVQQKKRQWSEEAVVAFFATLQ